MKVAIATPADYKQNPDVLAYAEAYGDMFTLTESIVEAASGADVMYTDVWSSMGMEAEAEKRKVDFAGYCIDDKLMSVTNPGCMVQHCLPAHRGEEITNEVFEAHAAEIFEEAENRLHAQKAIMATLMA